MAAWCCPHAPCHPPPALRCWQRQRAQQRPGSRQPHCSSSSGGNAAWGAAAIPVSLLDALLEACSCESACWGGLAASTAMMASAPAPNVLQGHQTPHQSVRIYLTPWSRRSLLSSPRGRGPLDFGSPLRRATDTLLVANALAFAAQWLSRDALTLWGAKVNSLIAAGQVWRLLTSSLLHTSLIHLLVSPPRGERSRGRGGCASRTSRQSLLTPLAASIGTSRRSTATRCTPSGHIWRWSVGAAASLLCTPPARSWAPPPRAC